MRDSMLLSLLVYLLTLLVGQFTPSWILAIDPDFSRIIGRYRTADLELGYRTTILRTSPFDVTFSLECRVLVYSSKGSIR